MPVNQYFYFSYFNIRKWDLVLFSGQIPGRTTLNPFDHLTCESGCKHTKKRDLNLRKAKRETCLQCMHSYWKPESSGLYHKGGRFNWTQNKFILPVKTPIGAIDSGINIVVYTLKYRVLPSLILNPLQQLCTETLFKGVFHVRGFKKPIFFAYFQSICHYKSLVLKLRNRYSSRFNYFQRRICGDCEDYGRIGNHRGAKSRVVNYSAGRAMHLLRRAKGQCPNEMSQNPAKKQQMANREHLRDEEGEFYGPDIVD